MEYYLKTPAANNLIVTVADLKEHLRVTHDLDDTYIGGLLDAAVDKAQQYTDRQLLPATLVLLLESFDNPVKIKKLPVASIASVKYYDENNEIQTLSTDIYQSDIRTEPAIIELKPDQSWPDITSERKYPVEIEFSAGYADASKVPDAFKHAVKLMVGNWYNYRDDLQKPLGMTTPSQNLLDPYKRAII